MTTTESAPQNKLWFQGLVLLLVVAALAGGGYGARRFFAAAIASLVAKPPPSLPEANTELDPDFQAIDVRESNSPPEPVTSAPSEPMPLSAETESEQPMPSGAPPATESKSPSTATPTQPATPEPKTPLLEPIGDPRADFHYATSKFGHQGSFVYQGQRKWLQNIEQANIAQGKAGLKRVEASTATWREVRRSKREIELINEDESQRVVLGEWRFVYRPKDGNWLAGGSGKWHDEWGNAPPPPVADVKLHAIELSVDQPSNLLPMDWRALYRSGRFERINNRWISTGWLSSDVPDAIQFPWDAPQAYALDASFIQQAGEGSLTFLLSMEERQVALVLNGYRERGFISGLESLDGHDLTSESNPTRRTGTLLHNGVEHKLHCEVADGKISAKLDGQPLVEWQGKGEQLSSSPRTTTKLPSQLGLIADSGSFEITQLLLTPRMLGTAPLKASGAVAGPVVEMLKRYPVTTCLDRGEIDDQNPGWLLGSPQGASTIVIPETVSEPYTLEVKLRKEEGTDALVVCLPVGDKRALVLINAYAAGFAGIETIGRLNNEPDNASKGIVLEPNKDYVLRCEVTANRIRALLNGQILATWEGDPGLIAPNGAWIRGQPGEIGISTWQTKYRLLSVKLQRGTP